MVSITCETEDVLATVRRAKLWHCRQMHRAYDVEGPLRRRRPYAFVYNAIIWLCGQLPERTLLPLRKGPMKDGYKIF